MEIKVTRKKKDLKFSMPGLKKPITLTEFGIFIGVSKPSFIKEYFECKLPEFIFEATLGEDERKDLDVLLERIEEKFNSEKD
jgi:hypothetical protein